MLVSLAHALAVAWMAYSSNHSGMVLQTWEAASFGADVYECDIALTPVPGTFNVETLTQKYGSPYTLVDCSK